MSYNFQRGYAFRIAFGITVLAFSLLAGVGIVQAGLPDVHQRTGFSDALKMPGRLNVTGTHFELNNSHYLNVVLDSSESVKSTVESVPQMVIMNFESASSATTTKMVMRGLAPHAVYQKYEDDYHNLVTFTTDGNGSYAYTQDLSKPHLVFIQQEPDKANKTSALTTGAMDDPPSDTIFIRDNATGGDCSLIGTWDNSTKICALTTDSTSNIQIDSNNITLEGNRHTLTGNDTGFGVYLVSKGGVTIKNLSIKNFSSGIQLYYGYENTLTNNTASLNYNGIYLNRGGNNTVTDNIANSNYNGIYLLFGDGEFRGRNTLTNNTANLNRGSGIILGYVETNNTLIGNNASNNNNFGIYLAYSSNNNTLIGNNASNNLGGISLNYSSNNTLKGNTMISNNNFGISLGLSPDNIIYNNYFNNANNSFDDGNNTWNITKTPGKNIIGGSWLGGNFWSDYAGNDTDGDGLGDTLLPYNSTGGIINGGDYLPLIQVTLQKEGIIHGIDFRDANGNKIRDSGEEILANRTIQLRGFDAIKNTPVHRTTVTDINGDYNFTNMNPGSYIVNEMPQLGWIPTTPSAILVCLGERESAAVDFGNRKI
jgi:parallel beta-helix repeat protein